MGADEGALKLRIEGLNKSYGSEIAVENLSLSVRDGELKSILGPSGCGKTTTLQCIAGLKKPDSGRIYIDDKLVTDPEQNIDTPPKDRDIGMVFQSFAVWPHLTVRENVRYPLDAQKIYPKSERDDKVEEIVELVELSAYLDNRPPQLSGGQQQRVAIARALVTQPKLLLFDEPLSNLDAKLRRDMRQEIQRICHELETTILYVTHSQDEAMFLSDEIALMNDGRVVEEGPPNELHDNPKTLFGMNFMGHCNIVEGSILSKDNGVTYIDSRIGTFQSTDDNNELQKGDNVFVCFRPKFCDLMESSTPGIEGTPGSSQSADINGGLSEESNTFTGTIVTTATTRDYSELTVDIQGTRVMIRNKELPELSTDTVDVTIPPSKVRMFTSASETSMKFAGIDS